MKHVPTSSLMFFVISASILALTACLPGPTTEAETTPIISATPSATPVILVTGGAALPYVELEAENAVTNGTIIGPDRTFKTLAAEASGRQAVTLSVTGQYVEFRLPQKANSLVIRYSIPDSDDGAGITAPLSLYINDARQADLSLTSKYSWVYGSYPFDNKPGGGNAHRFFDEAHLLLGQMEAGSTVRLQKDDSSSAASYTIDFADFEQVAPPLGQPADSLSVITYGADPTGAVDSTAAIQKAVNDGQSQAKVIWIPEGTYTVGHIIVGNNVTLQGAGMWYSVLHGYGVGVFGNTPSTNVHLSDFAIFGENIARLDSLPHEALGGAMGGGSVIQNIWIEHTKVGLWFNGPMDDATVTGLRIRDTFADGVNLHGAVSHLTFQQSNIRNTGDDGMAMWSDGFAGHDNVFQFNTVQMPNLANNIGIYGGYNNNVTDNYLADTLWQGSGVNYGNQYKAVAMSGTNLIARNTLVRAGSLDVNAGYGTGAIAFRAVDAAMTATINVNENTITDSSYEAIQFFGLGVSNVTFNTNRIAGAGTFGIQVQSPGAATFNDVTAASLGAAGIYQCLETFTITQGSDNSGWNTAPYCGVQPARVSTPTPTNTPCPGACPTARPIPPTRTNTPCPGGTCPTATAVPPTATNTPTATRTPAPGVAQGKPVLDDGHTLYFEAKNVTDGNLNTYWEGDGYPNLLTIDLGSAQKVTAVKIKLNPDPIWAARTQTISVLGSMDFAAFTTLQASAVYSFDPATGNQVTVSFPVATMRFVRLSYTTNTGAPNGQAAEFEVYDESMNTQLTPIATNTPGK